MVNLDKLRQLMVERQIVSRGIKDTRVISAFYEIPRHRFVPGNLESDNYEDHPLSIGNNQTISQPYIVALMTESLRLNPTDKVLEVGTGSGYQAAILSKLCSNVYTIERLIPLLEKAKLAFKELGLDNISVKFGDGAIGWEEFSPYDAIIVAAATPQVPKPLLDQLNDGGRLVIPLGGDFGQILTLIEKNKNTLTEKQICGCSFVPLIW